MASGSVNICFVQSHMSTLCSNVYGYHGFKANKQSQTLEITSSSEGGKINCVH